VAPFQAVQRLSILRFRILLSIRVVNNKYHIKLQLTIQKRVSLENDEYSSIVDKTLNIRQINTIMNLQTQHVHVNGYGNIQ